MEEMKERLIAWLTENGAELLVNVIVALLVIVIGRLVINMACRQMRAGLAKTNKLTPLLQGFIVNICHKVLWVIVIMIAVQRFVSVGPLIAGLGVTGFIIGFAFQESLGNFASGFMIAANQPFQVGDFVEVGGVAGVVREMNMMAVTLNTPDNKLIVAPNKSVWGTPITNYSALDTRRVEIPVGIAYGSDINQARAAIMEVLKSEERVLAEPAPIVELVAMADSSLNLVVRPWVKTPDYWAVFFRLQQRIKEALDANGIAIPFPQMDIHFDNPPRPAETKA